MSHSVPSSEKPISSHLHEVTPRREAQIDIYKRRDRASSSPRHAFDFRHSLRPQGDR